MREVVSSVAVKVSASKMGVHGKGVKVKSSVALSMILILDADVTRLRMTS